MARGTVAQIKPFYTADVITKHDAIDIIEMKLDWNVFIKQEGRQFDRLDQEGLSFHTMVRNGYLELVNIRKDLYRLMRQNPMKEECFGAVERYPKIFTK